jgi:L-alanine-DL-glutamate epimerase-like enolase superfamily enzyme
MAGAEVDSSPEVARAVVEAPTSHGIAHGLRSVLLGRDPFDVEELWELMFRKTVYYGREAVVLPAMSGVDIALWDILGKAAGKPVHKLPGASYRQRARAYASVLMPETPAEAERHAHSYAAQGFTAMKFGWGPRRRDEGLDAELVAAAREGAGDTADLMIDIGQRYTVKRAIRTAHRFEKFRIHWMEEPPPSHDFEGYRCLTAAVPLDLAAGEAESGRLAFKRLIEKGRIDVVQPDISRAGGLTETRKIAVMAHDANVRLDSTRFQDRCSARGHPAPHRYASRHRTSGIHAGGVTLA